MPQKGKHRLSEIHNKRNRGNEGDSLRLEPFSFFRKQLKTASYISSSSLELAGARVKTLHWDAEMNGVDKNASKNGIKEECISGRWVKTGQTSLVMQMSWYLTVCKWSNWLKPIVQQPQTQEDNLSGVFFFIYSWQHQVIPPHSIKMCTVPLQLTWDWL